MTQTMTPGRRRALDRKIAQAQLSHLIYLSTPEGGETRQQRRTRERIAAKTVRKMQKDKSRHGGKKEIGSRAEKEVRGSGIIQAPGQESD